MDIIYNILLVLGSLLIGYFIGSFPTAIVIGKLFFNEDPRDFGSKNAGGTNAGRIWGIQFGAIVMIVDVFKSILSLWLVYLLMNVIKFDNYFLVYDNGVTIYYLASLGATLGHCFPIYADFKGGKAVSTVAGFLITTSWFVTLLGLVFFVVLKWKKIVSLSSLVSAVTVSLAAFIAYLLNVFYPLFARHLMWGGDAIFIPNWQYAVIVFIMAILVFIRHHENIVRLKNNEERTIKWLK